MSEEQVTQPAPDQKPKRGRGQPKKITKEVARKIFTMHAHGMSDERIADMLDISADTIARAKKDREFCGVLKEAGALADEAVIHSLFLKATGYSHPETKVFCNEGEIIEHEVVKHYPPDATAAAFWLTNRRRDEWRKEIQHEENRPNSRPPMIRLLEKVSGKEAAVIKQTGRGIDVLMSRDFVSKIQADEAKHANGNGNGTADE